MLYDVLVAHHGGMHPDVLVAAGSALYGLYTRAKVTPVARPRDKAGRPLAAAQASPASAASGLGDEPTT